MSILPRLREFKYTRILVIFDLAKTTLQKHNALDNNSKYRLEIE